MKLRPLATLFLAFAALLLGPARALAANYTFELMNNTGLDPAQYSVYAMGFSTASQLVMGANGTFSAQSPGATVSSYLVGAGGLTQITLDTATAFTGGRLYFFVAPVGQPAPSVTLGTQPTNPPDTTFPPYAIVEITVPANTDATVDVQTVDGFVFPITITLNGNTNVAGQQYGQPVYTAGQTPTVNRADIFTAYTNFMTAAGSAGAPYLDLVFNPGLIAGQAGGILNPGAYLTTINAQNAYVNLGSALHTEFNAELGTLFGTTTLSLQGVATAAGQVPAIAADTYTVASTGNQTYPGTAISLPALQFQGTNVPANTFTAFNPVGIAVLTDDAGAAITGTVVGSTLTLAAPVSSLQTGMYVAGAGITTSGNNSATTITAIDGSHTIITLSAPYGSPTPNSQYSFCRLPQLAMFQTPGQMVLSNSGVFADSSVQFPTADSGQATVLGNLENQIVSALNRGVATNATALNPGTPGGTSGIWGTQTYWYAASATQNLFSLFMHTGAISATPIFFQPANAAAWPNARGQTMGAAYGFGYDENGGPVPPASAGQPEVPSKFDQNVPVGATMQINLGPWMSAVVPTPPAPPPVPPPAPKAKVDGKKTIKTTAGTVKIKGTAVGQELFVKYKNKKKGKTVTKRITIKSNGQWLYKFKTQPGATTLSFYAENANGARSKQQKVKVVEKTD